MTTDIATQIDGIGSAAGLVWHYLNDNGEVTLSKLARDLDAPRDLVMQGVGWLAREGKVRFRDGGRSKVIFLAET